MFTTHRLLITYLYIEDVFLISTTEVITINTRNTYYVFTVALVLWPAINKVLARVKALRTTPRGPVSRAFVLFGLVPSIGGLLNFNFMG